MIRLAILILILHINSLYAQTLKIKVQESKETVASESLQGMYSLIELDKKEIERAWEKKLKEYGKLTKKDNQYIITEAKVPDVCVLCQVYSKVEFTQKGTKVWWAFVSNGKNIQRKEDSISYRAAEKLLYEFTFNAYREDINRQIQDAEKALAIAVKTQEKKIREGEKLVEDSLQNRMEKKMLEEKLVKNEQEIIQLRQQIIQNKRDQAAAAEDVEKMKKAVEIVKNKLKMIE